METNKNTDRKRRNEVNRRKFVFERDNYTCQGCFIRFPEDELTLDHIVPRTRGGRNTRENLQTMCNPCNQKKGKKPWHAVQGTKLFPMTHRIEIPNWMK